MKISIPNETAFSAVGKLSEIARGDESLLNLRDAIARAIRAREKKFDKIPKKTGGGA